jgi:dihydroorotate dehydrogenase (fumarate)
MFVIKPILFLMSPDNVHSRMIKLASFFGRFSFARWFVRIIFNKPRNKRLEQRSHTIYVHTPVGLAAGFDKNGQIIPMMAALGFGFETVGSVTAKQCNGNPRPWFYRLPKTQSIVVNAGLANDGSDVVIKRIHQYAQKTIGQFPVILSVAKTNNDKVIDIKTGIADYITTIKRAKNERNVRI